MNTEFKLSPSFVEKYKTKKAPFGFNGLGELVYLRTYSRIKDNGENEKWFETVERVVNGTFNMQKEWIESHELGWNNHKAQKSAQEMYDRMFNMKFLPPGRGLWAMGSSLTKEKKLYASLNNCAFVSTENMKEDPTRPFTFLMDASMVGVGVGFDTKGAGTIIVKGPNKKRKNETIVIEDSREGWVESLKLLLECYFHGLPQIDFDYSKIREAGLPIKGFGGKSSGSQPLIDLHINISKVLDKEIGNPISMRAIVDIQNMIGTCVVAGNVRRCLPEDYEVLTDDGLIKLKDIKVGSKVIVNGESQEIKNVFDSGEQSVLKFKTRNSTEYEMTHKHTILVYNQDDGFVWKMAKDVNPSTDFLVKPKK